MADEENNENEGGKGRKKLLIIIGILVFILLLGGGGAAYYFMNQEAGPVVEEPSLPDKAIFLKLKNPEGRKMFIVPVKTTGNRARIMQIYAEAKVRTQQAADALTLHMPVVVSRLNTLFATQDFETINSFEGKEKLKNDATDIVIKTIEEKEGIDGVEEVMFTDFVIQ